MPNIDQVQLPDGSQYNLKDNISDYVTAQYVDDAIDALTKADVGLGNVDNTSDLNKPVSTAQQTALNGKTDTTVIAPTEATTTASKRYEIGEQFILNGVLYTATAVIASGDMIIVNTNCDLSDSITEQIANVDVSALANKSDLTDIFESGTTASQAISAGTYFYLNGSLVRAKTNISNGATFTDGTNYEASTIADGLDDMAWASLGSTPITTFYRKKNGVVYIRFSGLNITTTASMSLGTLPSAYRPEYRMSLRNSFTGNNDGTFYINADGTITFSTGAGAGHYVEAIISYPV